LSKLSIEVLQSDFLNNFIKQIVNPDVSKYLLMKLLKKFGLMFALPFALPFGLVSCDLTNVAVVNDEDNFTATGTVENFEAHIASLSIVF